MANSDGYPWDSSDDQLAYTRVFTPTRGEQARMNAAAQLQAAPAADIRHGMMRALPMPPRYAPGPPAVTILTCWQESAVTPVRSIMDFTDDEAALQATARPALGQW